jgi:glycosyltransferase involved in cell wall biosynthesis
MSGHRIIALLGKRDTPTDAVEEYCRHLGDALQAHDYELVVDRVGWDKRGWAAALHTLRRQALGWRGTWVLAQYTALAWSARGFPLRFLRVLKILNAAGVRAAVFYHDVEPFEGKRVIDRLRRRTQLRTMRGALRAAAAAIVTVPAEKLSWMRRRRASPIFIPVGANLSVSTSASSRAHISGDGKLAIAVFGITGGEAGKKEIEKIAGAIRFVVPRVKNLRLIVFGRNSQTAETEMRTALRGTEVELHVLGVLSEENVVRTLTISDVLLFVRGPISTRRSSAIAGIACGLPVIAYEGPETAPPITEAGLALFSPQRKGDLGEVLLRVLEDEHYRASLAQQSWVAQQQYFSWRTIAARYAEILGKPDPLRTASEGLPKG